VLAGCITHGFESYKKALIALHGKQHLIRLDLCKIQASPFQSRKYQIPFVMLKTSATNAKYTSCLAHGFSK
jgi:hypothetical protein